MRSPAAGKCEACSCSEGFPARKVMLLGQLARREKRRQVGGVGAEDDDAEGAVGEHHQPHRPAAAARLRHLHSWEQLTHRRLVKM